MNTRRRTPRRWIGSLALIGAVIGAGALLAAWKLNSIEASEQALANQPEPVELVSVATALTREHRETTAAIGTILALRSVTLRNELAGTVRRVALTPGQIVQEGTVLVALDVSVEQAELEAQEAQAKLAETTLRRLERLRRHEATSQEEVDQARAQLDVALANIARTQAIIGKKTVRAPFRARVGIADVHPGQYLNEGTVLTTLQGVSDAVHVDFTVPQLVAAGLGARDSVAVSLAGDARSFAARIVAIDARVNPTTRNALVRARIANGTATPPPGASVRVLVPVGPARQAVVVPVSAVRKGPGGDHVFMISTAQDGTTRAHLRPVRVGTMIGDEIVIEDGLDAGDQVAASGSFKLRDAVRVAIAGDAGATPVEPGADE